MNRRTVAVRAALPPLVAMVLLSVAAVPAAAHAVLEITAPQQGSQVSSAPNSVFLRFSEAVGINERSIVVIDAQGHRVDTGRPVHPQGTATGVEVGLRRPLPKASYTVVWHVVSADSHPVSGTFTFGYGVPAAGASVQVVADRLVGVLDTVFRAGAYAGIVVLIGGAVFLIRLWPEGMQGVRQRRLLIAGWLAATVCTAVLFLLEGPYGASLGVSALGDPALAKVTFSTIYGKLLLLRLVALVAVVPVWLSARRSARVPSLVDAAGLAFLAVVSFSFAGHAGQGSAVPLSATMDALHMAGAGVWLGGLAVLAVSLPGTSSAGALDPVLPRWSNLALVAVVVLIGTGIYQAWREIGSLGAVIGTDYGRLVLAKASALVVLLVLANRGRRWVRGTRAGAGLRTSVLAEVGIGAVVLGLTASLVTSVPARIAYTPPFTTRVTAPGTDGTSISLILQVAATKTGPETADVYAYTSSGKVLPFLGASGMLVHDGGAASPVRFNFLPAGTGHGRSTGLVVPARGRWRLTVQLFTDPLTGYTATTIYRVR